MPNLGGTRMTAAIRILLFSVVGTLFPAVANTITFNEAPLFTSINGQTIKGVLFSFVANYSNGQAIIFGGSNEPSNVTEHYLLLPGEASEPGKGPAATLSLNFLNGPVTSLSFQFAVPSPDCQCALNAGSLELFDSADSPLGVSSYLFAQYNPSSHSDEGTFIYRGAPVSRAVLTVANLVNNGTTPIIDTITFQETPESGTMFGVASALIGLAVIRRKHHR
jgi:hypothetical protein